MDTEISALEGIIRQILTAPGTDLATISAKRVRKQLLDLDSSLTAEFVKANKDPIDQVIATVFEEVNASQQGDDNAVEEVGSKRKRSDASDSEEGRPPAGAAPKKTKKAKSKQEQTDEELARQLQTEINGRGRSSRTAAGKPNANGKKRGAKKSAKRVADSEGESGDDDKPKKRGGGFKKEYILSEPLATLLQVDKLSRPQIVKQLWDHIKANNMQNPENKKEIICDDQFRAIFKCDRIDMFKMNKELGQHLYEPQAAAS